MLIKFLKKKIIKIEDDTEGRDDELHACLAMKAINKLEEEPNLCQIRREAAEKNEAEINKIGNIKNSGKTNK